MPVKNQTPNRDYIGTEFRRVNYLSTSKGSQAPKPTQDYHPETVMGACTECKRVGFLDFPPGTFNWDAGDDLMNRKKVIIYCPQCNAQTEFVPVPPEKSPEEALEWLKGQEKMHRKRRLSG